MSKQGDQLTEDLQYRGLIFQFTGENLEEITQKQRTIYLGIDPTGDSLHVGHLLQLLIVRRFIDSGHKVIVLLGGGTATIGDPSGKNVERNLLDESVVNSNVERLRKQIETLLGGAQFEMVNNAEWYSGVPVLVFMRDIGKHFSINEMLRKESVRRRIEDPNSAISYTEFSYMLLQAYDFYVLNEKYGCDVQLGGSDQWGNITAGVELIRKKRGFESYGITAPLLVDPVTGRKFGKTESGGAVWLDPQKTSPFQFFQFWYNSADGPAKDYIKYYTLLPHAEIEATITDSELAPEKRILQGRLAYEVTMLVHGEEEAKRAQHVSAALFNGDFTDLDKVEREALLHVVPNYKIERTRIESGLAIVDLLVECGLATSKRDARTLVEGGGVSLHGMKMQEPMKHLTEEDFPDTIVLLKKGKRDIMLLEVV